MSAIEGNPVAISSLRGFPGLTHTGPRLIANDALRKAHLPWMLAVSDRTRFAEREIMECSQRVLRSFHFDVREPHNLAPLFSFVRDKLSEVGGRARSHRDAQVGKPCPHIGVGECRIDFLVE